MRCFCAETPDLPPEEYSCTVGGILGTEHKIFFADYAEGAPADFSCTAGGQQGQPGGQKSFEKASSKSHKFCALDTLKASGNHGAYAKPGRL
eukprot:9189704-Karenia_brevis.AAC.1